MRWKTGMGLGLLLAGCATSGTIDTSRTDAETHAAEAVGANSDPQAKLHLQLAREETQKAQKLAKDGDEESAQRMLARAQADGELAVAQAKDAQAKNEAQQALDKVNAIKAQAQQPTANP